MVNQNLPKTIHEDSETEWKPYFFPKDFVNENLGITTENYKIKERELLKHGKDITKLRKAFRDKAEEEAKQSGQRMNYSN